MLKGGWLMVTAEAEPFTGTKEEADPQGHKLLPAPIQSQRGRVECDMFTFVCHRRRSEMPLWSTPA